MHVGIVTDVGPQRPYERSRLPSFVGNRHEWREYGRDQL